MTTELKNIYLMWVGSEHYPTIDSYCEEADKLGCSKRLPNASVAGKLLSPGTVIFIAHDEGEAEPCPECEGVVENPDRRKAVNRVRAQERRCKRLYDEWTKADKAARKSPKDEDAQKEAKRAKGFVARAHAKLTKLEKEAEEVPEYIEDSTGGSVHVDGEAWDYRRYNYWLHQPKKWSPDDHEVTEKTMCECCGGTGRLPLGKVFGMFLPSAIEYIMRPEDGDAVRAEMEAKGVRVVTPGVLAEEAKRGCGRRRAGGYYAVSDTSTTEPKKKTMEEAVKRLIEAGVIEDESEVKLNGDFIRFVSPVDIPGTKRFRGIKSWSLSVAVEEEAEMIMEAV